LDRILAAQQIAIEISILVADLQSINTGEYSLLYLIALIGFSYLFTKYDVSILLSLTSDPYYDYRISEIKDMQRESYFLGLEKKRKKLIVQKLSTEIEDTKRQLTIQKKLSAKIQKEAN